MDMTLPWNNSMLKLTAKTTVHRNSEHITLRQTWFSDDAQKSGAHINHAVMFERKVLQETPFTVKRMGSAITPVI